MSLLQTPKLSIPSARPGPTPEARPAAPRRKAHGLRDPGFVAPWPGLAAGGRAWQLGAPLLPRGEPGRLAVSRPGASARTSSPRGHLPGAEPARQCRLCHFLSGSFPDHIPVRGRLPSVSSYNALSPSRSPPGVSHLRLIFYVSAPLTEVGGLTAEAECCPSSHSWCLKTTVTLSNRFVKLCYKKQCGDGRMNTSLTGLTTNATPALCGQTRNQSILESDFRSSWQRVLKFKCVCVFNFGFRKWIYSIKNDYYSFR